jgi:hypothetical protein
MGIPGAPTVPGLGEDLNALDILVKLQPASWRGVPFPVLDMDVAWSHDRAHHKVYKKPVSNVETTGRNSREFSFDIPFRNGVVPGPVEDELRGRPLYPDLYRAFEDAFNEPTTGELVHPLYGKVKCKPGTIRVVCRGTERDGVTVHVTFDETDDNPDGTSPAPDAPSPITGISQEADALDAMLLDVVPPLVDENGNAFSSFADYGALLRSPFDTLTGLSIRIGGVINAFSAELDRLKESVDLLEDVGLWPIIHAIESLKDSLTDLVASQSAKLHRFEAPKRMPVAQLLGMLHVDMDTLISFNPQIVDGPYVEEGTTVIYPEQ